MKCVSAMSTARNTDAALQQILQQLDQGLAGDSADLTLIFSSMHHADELGRIASAFLEQARTHHVLGCTGESIVGDLREVEGSPALSVWSINMPGVSIRPLRLGEPGDFDMIPAEGIENPERSVVLLLGDPFSFRTDDFLRQVNNEVRGLRVIGGMASGSQVPRGNQLVLDGETFVDGAVAMLLGGPLSIATVVSQGCRPIGRPLIVTRADGNVIHELGRRPALEALRDMFQELSSDDQRRIQDGLHLGRVINEYQGSFQRGDFLVRNVMGADDSGAIQITDVVRVGQTVQFHVRDAETADEDLRKLLEASKPSGNRLGPCSSPATVAARGCSRRPITT